MENGFYEILDKGEGTSFPCNDGRSELMGKRLAINFGKPAISAESVV